MPFTNQEIFLFLVLIPLVIFAGKKLRGDSVTTQPPKPARERLPPDLQRKIDAGYYRDGEMLLLAAFEADVEANIVRSLLIDSGIYAEIRDAMIGSNFGYSHAIGGVKIFVHEREYADARLVLAEHQAIARQEGDEWRVRSCARCGSDMLTYQKYHPLSALVLFLGAPFLPLKAGRWVCLKCGHKWKE